MANRRKRKMEEATATKAEMEMTPMIDVTFLLLIFFMCTIKFKTLEGKLAAYLPKDVGVNTSKAEPIEKIEIKLTVTNEGSKLNAKGTGPYEGEGRYKYGADRELSYSVGPVRFSTVAEVKDRLIVLYNPTDPRPVTIDPRKGVVYSDVVKVLDAAIQAKFREITFAGSYEK
ncbi:ExbD/TolR family protein [Engelhardtia mirabilis]|uniref:Biopolymer transport protein ExbD/TolR n=1 Tax=Engelhardtia mirabilis TaxID=2528011 RepID=A0A518BI95_9BACT|nr:Biopolymer transport protein ExbD/TolR [Planctomycetes bacterium Pla133]QDV00989.1 Biopolymer transport protein ExbD/TolR [Planctomycetes bacterium Pla86]